MLKRILVGFVAFIGLITLGLFTRSLEKVRGRNIAPGEKQLARPIPTDTSVLSGDLDNGLRYYLLNNPWPEKRIELRLVVGAGSVHETENQRGLAHAVEHMLFRGTKRFPSQSIDNYLQSIGMRSGQDLNAFTSMDQTEYTMTIPTDRPGVLDTAIAILADMAHEATFDPAEARVEAGVVFEEWRRGSDASGRLYDQRNKLLLAGSPYVNRDPIGDTTVLRRFDIDEMRRFYTEWYRPELMAVIVVGDIETYETRKILRKHFNAIPKSKTKKTRPELSVPIVTGVIAASLTDLEATGSRVSLLFPRPKTNFRQNKDYRNWIISEMWQEVLNDRLEDASEAPGSPLISTFASRTHPVLSLEADVVSATIADGQAMAAIDAMTREIKRLTEHGPTERELETLKEHFIKEHWKNAEYFSSSDDLADSYSEHFTSGSAVVTREVEYDLVEWLLPTVTKEEVRLNAQQALNASSAMVVVIHPDKRDNNKLSSDALAARFKSAMNEGTVALVESTDSVELMSTVPQPGRITSEKFLRDIETFDMTLSNGMRVLLKPTEFTNSNVEFRMTGFGGASLASDADYPSALMSDNVILATGVGTLNGIRLQRLIDESSLVFSQRVSDTAIDFSGEFAPRDLKQFFQLLYLTFTAPREDSVAFRRYRDRVLSSAGNRSSDPDEVFADSVAVITVPKSTRALRFTEAFYSAVELPKAVSFWKARMANASGFTLVLTGDFTITQIRPFLERYLASLPGGMPETARDFGARYATGTIERTVRAGIGPRARTSLNFFGPAAVSLESSEAMSAARDVAERALDNKIRESMGGTYAVDVILGLKSAPPAEFHLSVEFEASPTRIDSLATAARAELLRLSTSGPTQVEFERSRSARARDLDNTAESNSYWARELLEHGSRGWSLSSITSHQQQRKDITLAQLKEACAKYLNPGQYVRVTMLPRQSPMPQK